MVSSPLPFSPGASWPSLETAAALDLPEGGAHCSLRSQEKGSRLAIEVFARICLSDVVGRRTLVSREVRILKGFYASPRQKGAHNEKRENITPRKSANAARNGLDADSSLSLSLAGTTSSERFTRPPPPNVKRALRGLLGYVVAKKRPVIDDRYRAPRSGPLALGFISERTARPTEARQGGSMK